MIITTTNEFLITWLVGTAEVVEYQIYNRLFLLVGTLFALALTPIWSTVTKALSEKNYNWIKKLFKILNLIALIAVVCEFAMIPFLQLGINIWLGENTIKVNYYYAVIFAISGSVFIWNGVLSSIANGLGELKTQSIFLTVGAFIKIPVAWFLVTIFDSWIGVIVANIVAMSLYSIIQPLRINKLLKNLRR
jgi:Na+-driven multidrug efflux pump